MAGYTLDAQAGNVSITPAPGFSVTQSNAFATEGTFGLEVTGTTNNWLGVQLPQPVDLSARRALTYDVRTGPGEGVGAAARIFLGECAASHSLRSAPPTPHGRSKST